MNGYVIGLAVGLSIGLITGIAIGKKEKSWSELSPQEKKLKITAVSFGVIMLIAGIIVFLVVRSKTG
jgi:hypothetical protein